MWSQNTFCKKVLVWNQVDPAAESFYGLSPYVSMGNNPVSFIDPDGDFLIAALVGAAVGVLANGIVNSIKGNPFFQNWEKALFMGALGGALTGGSLSVGAGMLRAGSSVASSYLPGVNISIGNININLSPSLVFGGGNGAWNIGLNATISGSIGNFPFAFGGGIGYGKDYYSTFTGWNYRGFGAIGYKNFMISSTYYKAACLPGQRIGGFHYNNGPFSITYLNDGTPFGKWAGDGQDRYRSAAVRVGYGDFEVGFNIFTGQRGFSTESGVMREIVGGIGAHNFLVSTAYFGYKGWRVGFNDWHVGYLFQNKIAHGLIKPQAWFKWKTYHRRPIMLQYSGYYSNNPFTTW